MGRAVLHALLALAVMLSGMALPAASAGIEEPDAPATSAHHMGHGTAPERAPTGSEPEAPMTDCCQAGDCDCGCTAPQVLAPRMAATPQIPAVLPAAAVLLGIPRVSDTEGVPFRPPA